jgi:hypothetical protein
MTDDFDFDVDGFEEDLLNVLKESKKAFMGKYKESLNELAGLSREEIDKITPDITDLQKYDELMVVVKAASAKNTDQAELKRQIEELGDVAIKVAAQVPSLVKLLAL